MEVSQRNLSVSGNLLFTAKLENVINIGAKAGKISFVELKNA